MNARCAMLAAVVACGAVLAAGGTASAAVESKKPVIRPVSELKWENNASVPGSQVATIWGDPQKGAYGALKKIPMGVGLPMHTHSREQRVIVIEGTMALWIEGSALTEMGPGSYAVIPAGIKHAANCHTGVDCVYFEEQPGAADIIPVGRGTAKK